MNPLSVIYWSRLGFAVLAAVVCILLNSPELITNISIGILVFLFSYYIYRWVFAGKVTKNSKFITTGIGAYFVTWVVLYVLLYNLLYYSPV